MPSLLFNCPKTNQQVSTGIGTDVQSLRASWKTTVKVNCPHCGEVHEMSVRETYLEGVLPNRLVAPGRPRPGGGVRSNGGNRRKLAVQKKSLPKGCD
jgi:hypothetical protein